MRIHGIIIVRSYKTCIVLYNGMNKNGDASKRELWRREIEEIVIKLKIWEGPQLDEYWSQRKEKAAHVT